MNSTERLMAEFRRPASRFGIVPMMHGLCAQARKGRVLAETLARLRRRGFGCVLTNPEWNRDYLREWDALKRTVAGLDKAGMEVILYDERGYPSGFAGGRVLEQHPELISLGLMTYRWGHVLSGKRYFCCDAPDGRIWKAWLLPADDDPSGRRVSLDGRRDITRSQDRHRTFHVDVPEGRWVFVVQFIREQYDATHPQNSCFEPRRMPNLLDRRAGEAFVKVTHEQFAAAVGRHFGRCVRAVFTDEPSLQPPLHPGSFPYTVLPWHDGLPEQFRRRYGCDIDEALLAASVSDVGPDSGRLRCDFWELVADECSNAYFAPIEEWAAKNGVAATGHLLWEDDLNRHASFEGSYFRAMRRFQIPGIDTLDTQPESLMRRMLAPKLASSVAHLMGKPEILSEASDHNERSSGAKPATVADVKASMNWHFALGVNLITSYYRLDAFSDRAMRDLNAYVARLGTLMREGEHVARVAVLYPEQSMWAATVRGLGAAEMKALQQTFGETVNGLLGRQIDFDFVDEPALREAAIGKCGFTVEARTYRALVLPRVTLLDQRLAGAIAALARAGVPVLAVGALPERAREAGGDRKMERAFRKMAEAGRIVLFESVNARFLRTLRGNASLIADPASDRLLVHQRNLTGSKLFLVANMAREAYCGRLSLRGSGAVTEWNPADGSVHQVPVLWKSRDTVISVKIPALGALVYRLAEESSTPTCVKKC